MNVDDLKVEVRDGAQVRQGVILGPDYELKATVPINAVGEWSIKTPRTHPLASYLTTPGAGLIVTDMRTGQVIFSGPMTSHETAWTLETPEGELTVSGVTDEVVLEDALAWPDPDNANSMAQGQAVDERNGPVETLLHEFVSANIGPDAAPSRRNDKLVMGTNNEQGPIVTAGARWENLLELLTKTATGSTVTFRVTQIGSYLRFDTYLPSTTPLISLRADNGQLASVRVIRRAPDITRAFVGGKDGGVSRSFVERSNSETLAAEDAWSRRIERFVDQRSGTLAALQAAGDQRLADDTEAGVSAQFEPNEELAATYGIEWVLGDPVRLAVEDNNFVAPIASLVLLADKDGVRVGATIGDASVFVPEASMKRSIVQMASRVGYLETSY